MFPLINKRKEINFALSDRQKYLRIPDWWMCRSTGTLAVDGAVNYYDLLGGIS